MIYRFDIRIVLKSTIKYILKQSISMIFCIKLKLLYNCLVKLGTTKEKRLIVEIMCLWQFYKRQKIIEIRYINKNNNFVNAIIKTKPCYIL